MRRKLLPQTEAAVIRQHRATAEIQSLLNHGDVLNDAFLPRERRVSSRLIQICLPRVTVCIVPQTVDQMSGKVEKATMGLVML